MLKKIKKIILKHKIIFLLVLVISTSGVYFIVKAFNSNTSTISKYTIGTVEKGSLITTTSGTGQVYVSDQIDIRAKVSGDVIDVYKVVGDKVKVGDVIMKLDTKDISKQIINAQLSVETAKDKLNNLISPDKLSVLQAESALKNAKDNLEKLKLSQTNTYKQAQDSKTNAETSLTNSYSSVLNTIDSSFSGFATITNDLRTILFLTDGIVPQDITGDPLKDQNLIDMDSIWDVEIPEYWQDIVNSYSFDSTTDKETLLDLAKRATATYKNAKIIYDQNIVEYRTLSKFSDKAVLESFLDKTINTSQTLTEATRNIGNLYSFFINYNNERKRTIYYNINNYNTTLKTDTSSANNYLTNLISAKNNIASSKTSLSNAIITLTNLEKNQPLDLAAQETSLKIQEETYNNFKNPSSTDIKSARLSLAQAQQTLSEYQENLKNCSITATFDGVISTMTADLGDDISVGDSLATVVTENMVAQLSFNEVDIAKIKVGQKATLTFDAISDLSLSGKVIEVDSVGTVSQGVVSYTVKIAFDVQDERIKSGMSVTADIITEVKQDVLLVPTSAVKTNADDTSYVEMFKNLSDDTLTTLTTNDLPEKVIVEAGSSNDDYTEVSSGLSEGDKIVTKTTSVSSKDKTSSTKNSSSTTKDNNSSLFNLTGATSSGPGGMMPPN